MSKLIEKFGLSIFLIALVGIIRATPDDPIWIRLLCISLFFIGQFLFVYGHRLDLEVTVKQEKR
jgi:hypothetical protein